MPSRATANSDSSCAVQFRASTNMISQRVSPRVSVWLTEKIPRQHMLCHFQSTMDSNNFEKTLPLSRRRRSSFMTCFLKLRLCGRWGQDLPWPNTRCGNSLDDFTTGGLFCQRVTAANWQCAKVVTTKRCIPPHFAAHVLLHLKMFPEKL